MLQAHRIKPKDLALMASHLQAPMVIADILSKRSDLDDDTRFGLHDLLSEMQPDSVLLTIALAVKPVAEAFAPASASMGVMAMECGRLMEEYGHAWLAQLRQQDPGRISSAEILGDMIEDLEYFIELLELGIDFLRAKDALSAEIFEILFVQARAHLLIAEEFLHAASSVIPPMLAQQALAANNIIQFPGSRK